MIATIIDNGIVLIQPLLQNLILCIASQVVVAPAVIVLIIVVDIVLHIHVHKDTTYACVHVQLINANVHTVVTG